MTTAPDISSKTSGVGWRALIAAILPVTGYAVAYWLGEWDLQRLGLEQLAIGPPDSLSNALFLTLVAIYAAGLFALGAWAFRDRRHLNRLNVVQRVLVIGATTISNIAIGYLAISFASLFSIGPIQS